MKKGIIGGFTVDFPDVEVGGRVSHQGHVSKAKGKTDRRISNAVIKRKAG